MKNITFIFFAYNEEKRIESVVKNCINYGKVLILDGGSSDSTEAISTRNGARFVVRPKMASKIAESQEMYDFIKEQVDTDWIFWGFCDNLMPKSALEKFVELSKQNKIKYVVSPMYTYLWGKNKNPAIKTMTPRFFMKDYMDFTGNKIHGMGKFLGKEDEELRLPMIDEYAIRHFSLYDLNKFISAHLNYAEIEALDRFESGRKFGFFVMTKSILKEFVYWYKDGYKNKLLGLMVAIMYCFFRFMVFFRLYEIENGLTLETMGNDYLKEGEKLKVKKVA